MLSFLIGALVLFVAVALSIEFYERVRRAQGTLDDDPYNDHFDWNEWEKSLLDDLDNLGAQSDELATELPPAVKSYETAKKTRARVRKTVAKKPSKKPVKKAVKRITKTPASRKKVTRG
jgi:hypothetical protein